MKNIILQIFLVLFFCSDCYSQKIILTAGKDASGSGGSVSCSIGQVTYFFNTGSSGSEAQGVQQPFEISVVQEVKNATIHNINKSEFNTSLSAALAKSDDKKIINLKCDAYPNPTIDLVTLTINFIESGNHNLSYQLFDLSGKLIESKNIKNNTTRIDMHKLVAATYVLIVVDGNKSLKTFQIIKN